MPRERPAGDPACSATWQRRGFWRAVGVSLVALATTTGAAAAPGEKSIAPWGFENLEIYRASDSAACVRPADLDGDGRLDLAFAYNSDTSIRLLLQTTGKQPVVAGDGDGGNGAAAKDENAELNDIQFDRRFETVKIYTEKEVRALDVGDLDGDRKPDLAFYGDPPELVVIYQSGEWGSKQVKFPITDGTPSTGALRVRDVDADGRLDIVLLGKGKTYIIRQNASGALGSPEILYNAYADATSIEVVDVDDNGEVDLVTFVPRSKSPVIVRFQHGRVFGSESRYTMSTLRDAIFADLDGQGSPELVTVQGNTRRVLGYRWGQVESARKSYITEPRLFSFRQDRSAPKRNHAVGDVDGDGRTDIVVTYGDAAEADVLLQRDGGLARPVGSPTLSDVRGAAIGNFDGDERPEVAFVSGDEKVIGLSSWLESGRLSIPRTFPTFPGTESEPVLIQRCALPSWFEAGRGHDAFFVVARGVESKKYSLALVRIGAENKLVVIANTELDARAQPSGLRILDINGDGLLDCALFVPYESPRIIPLEKRDADSGPQLAFGNDLAKHSEFGAGQIARADATTLTSARFPIGRGDDAGADATPRDDILVCSKTHARALRLDPSGRLEILEQFSVARAGANLAGVTALDLDDDADLEVVVFDEAAGMLDVLDRGERGIYGVASSIELPGFKLQGFERLDLDGDGALDLVMVGDKALAVFERGRDEMGFVEFASYDPGGDDDEGVKRFGQPATLCHGDLNADGRREVIFATQPKYYLSTLAPEGGGKLAGKLDVPFRFQIFEEKSYMRSGLGYGPREMTVADVSGDGKDDLVMLIHDRLLLYIQE